MNIREKMQVERVITKAITNAGIVGGPARTRDPSLMVWTPGARSFIDYIPTVTYGEGAALGYIAAAFGGAIPAPQVEGAAKLVQTLALAAVNEDFVTFAGHLKASTSALADIEDIPNFLDVALRRLVRIAIDTHIIGKIATVYAGAEVGWAKIAAAANAASAASNIIADTVALAPATLMSLGVADPWSVNPDATPLGLNFGISYGLAPGDFAVGPFAGYSMLAMRDEFSYSIGTVADDFTKNMRTIVAEARGVWTTPALNAFRKGTI